MFSLGLHPYNCEWSRICGRGHYKESSCARVCRGDFRLFPLPPTEYCAIDLHEWLFVMCNKLQSEGGFSQKLSDNCYISQLVI